MFPLACAHRPLSLYRMFYGGYTQRIRIPIAASPDGLLTNHQIRLRLVRGAGTSTPGVIYLHGQCRNWPHDIRFTASDGITPIDFYRVESDTLDGTWIIEVPSIPATAGTSVYLHFGKASEASASNPTNTLEAPASDFASVGTSLFEFLGTGTKEFLSGVLHIKTTSSWGQARASTIADAATANRIIELKFKVLAATSQPMTVERATSDLALCYWQLYHANSDKKIRLYTRISNAGATRWTSTQTYLVGSEYYMRLVDTGSTINVFLYDSSWTLIESSGAFAYDSGAAKFDMRCGTTNDEAHYSELIVRKYTPNEPTLSSPGSIEYSSDYLFELPYVDPYPSHIAGKEQASWGTPAGYLSGGTTSPGRTAIFGGLAVRQDGHLNRVRLNVTSIDSVSAWKIKVFRESSSTYAMVGEQSFTPVVGVNEVVLSPATPVQMGDVCGLFIPSSVGDLNRLAIGDYTVEIPTRYTTGDITTSDAFASTTTYDPQVEAQAESPYFAITGDSIIEGHSVYYGSFQSGTSPPTRPGNSNRSAEVGYMVQQALEGTPEYQTLALGGVTYAWVRSTGAPLCFATGAQKVVMACGVNDVAQARSWSQVQADLDAIKILFDASDCEGLLVCEILPWTNGTDGQAATVRTFNANIAAWCTANGATLISCHDEMGQIRGSTGQLDNLITAYDQDGVHLTPVAGVAKFAEIIARYL